MKKLLLIIISGPPGTGKTTLAKKLSTKYSLPLLYKDGFKEILFDKLGIQNRAWSEDLGEASHTLLNHTSEQLLKTNISHILEAPFKSQWEDDRLNKLKDKYKFTPIQIQLSTEKHIIYQRMKNRANNKERHIGHTDDYNIKEKDINTITESYKPLDIGGSIYYINTNDFNTIDLNEIYNDIDSKII